MFRLEWFRISVVCLASVFWCHEGVAQPTGSKGEPMFNGKNFSGWYKFSGDKKINTEELILMDPFEKHIIIKGTGAGYLVTDKKYNNYQLSLEWRWAFDPEKSLSKPDERPKRQSGVLFHIAGEGDLIWPKSILAKLDAGRAGDLQLLKNFKLSVNPERIDRKMSGHFLRSHDGAEKQPGDWNECVITCHGKFISVTINGQMVMAGRESEFSSGRIALQSDTGEIHFRNVFMKPLQGKPVDPEKDD